MAHIIPPELPPDPIQMWILLGTGIIAICMAGIEYLFTI